MRLTITRRAAAALRRHDRQRDDVIRAIKEANRIRDEDIRQKYRAMKKAQLSGHDRVTMVGEGAYYFPAPGHDKVCLEAVKGVRPMKDNYLLHNGRVGRDFEIGFNAVESLDNLTAGRMSNDWGEEISSAKSYSNAALNNYTGAAAMLRVYKSGGSSFCYPVTDKSVSSVGVPVTGYQMSLISYVPAALPGASPTLADITFNKLALRSAYQTRCEVDTLNGGKTALNADLTNHIVMDLFMVGIDDTDADTVANYGTSGDDYSVDDDRHNITITNSPDSTSVVHAYEDHPEWSEPSYGKDLAILSLSGDVTKTASHAVIYAYAINYVE